MTSLLDWGFPSSNCVASAWGWGKRFILSMLHSCHYNSSILWSYSSIMVWRSHFYLNASWGENTAGKPKKGAMAVPAIEYVYQLSWQYQYGCPCHRIVNCQLNNLIIFSHNWPQTSCYICLALDRTIQLPKHSSTFESANRWRWNMLVKSSVSVQQGR